MQRVFASSCARRILPAVAVSSSSPSASATISRRHTSSSSKGEDKKEGDSNQHHTAAENAALILESLKKKDFNSAQAQAYQLAQSGLSDEYAVPIACVLALIITFYWARSSHNSAVRSSDTHTSNTVSTLGELYKKLDDVSRNATEGMQKRNKSMETIQQANGELTTVIDQMTAALRQC